MTLNLADSRDGTPSTLEVDVVLISIGRHAFTGGLGLENTDVITNDRGQVEINENWQTKVPNIYGIGDAV